ncbi:MAG: response regulator [Chloroflexota bacterium]|nr:response regulator [Chloroflexota bacterium]
MQKILIVEDDPIIQDLVYATLAGDLRYQLLQAREGQSGLQLAQTEHPSIILLDLDLPLLGGLELCRSLKADPSYSQVKVIMLTALSQPADIERGEQAGADAYLVKPFSPLNLLRKIDRMLEIS